MTKLIIDERDLRCTILEGVCELLNRAPWAVTSDEEKVELAKPLIDAVIACCDPADTKPGETYTQAQLEGLLHNLDNGSEWETVDEFWWVWGPRVSPRIATILRTAIRACQALTAARAQPRALLDEGTTLPESESEPESEPEPVEQCTDCGAPQPHFCQGVPGGFSDDGKGPDA